MLRLRPSNTHQPKKQAQVSVGAGAEEMRGEGLYGRPRRPCPVTWTGGHKGPRPYGRGAFATNLSLMPIGRPQGVSRPPSVILSRAKDLHSAPPEILRCAQDDRWASVNTPGGTPRGVH